MSHHDFIKDITKKRDRMIKAADKRHIDMFACCPHTTTPPKRSSKTQGDMITIVALFLLLLLTMVVVGGGLLTYHRKGLVHANPLQEVHHHYTIEEKEKVITHETIPWNDYTAVISKEGDKIVLVRDGIQ